MKQYKPLSRPSEVDPLVSIIIPTYNRADFVGQAIESALNQTYEPTEVIVVDDGSIDGTKRVLEKYGTRLRTLYQERSERSKARNEGIRHSTGDYVAFLDSDDLWLPTKIADQMEVFRHNPQVGLVYTDVGFIDADGNPYEGAAKWDQPVRSVLYEDLMTNNVITGSLSSVLIKRECLQRIGLFDESMITCEDLDLYRRIAVHYEFRKVEVPLVKIRIHGQNTQSSARMMAKGWETTITKISRNTPPRFIYYKYQAISKILFHIAMLYWQGNRPQRFFFFCGTSLIQGRDWILRYGFWKEFVRLSGKRLRVMLENRRR